MNKQYIVEVAQTILNQIKENRIRSTPGWVVMGSWGFNSPSVVVSETAPGVQFNVNGMKHRGIVRVVLNLGMDMYSISFLTAAGVCIKKIDDVFADQLISLIDGFVESN